MERDTDFPWAIEIPIPAAGLGPMLPVILDAAKACAGGAKVTTRSEPPNAEIRSWFHWIATKSAADAQRLERTFRSIGARRIR